jgi:chromosomal replication initiation ATPase DnaA
MERCSHCGSPIKFENIREFLQLIKELIEKDQLNVPSRSRPKNNRRYYLYRKMRDIGMSLQSIGDYFGRDHATVLHGLKMNDSFAQTKDLMYLKDTEEYDNIFQNNK